MMRDTTQMQAGTMQDPLGIPMTRSGSGTTWLPDRSPMHAKHVMAGNWELMLHGLAFVQYDKQYTRRGDSQFGAPNWGMLMASHALGSGRLQLRGMVSLDPFTITSRGYPLLLQSGEAYQGQPLHDRQHPHDLFMELAAIYEYPLGQNVGLQLYLAPVGEPASGPVAFPHRPSASSDPLAPLGHHWQDATHISFGVATAALYTRTLKLEGSVFNGREPDEIRTNFDYKGRSLDSYAGRLSFNPSANVSLTGSYAYLKTPETLHPERSQHRVTASALYGRTLGAKGEWSSALIYGANKESGDDERSHSVLAESNLDLDGTNSIFGRVEFVQKSAADLAVAAADQQPVSGRGAFAQTSPDTRFNVGAFVLGYLRETGRFTGGSMGLGARGSITMIPSALEPAYGTRTPAGFSVFVRLRPGRMQMGGHGGMQMGGGDAPMAERAVSRDHAEEHGTTARDTASMAGMAHDTTMQSSMRRDSTKQAMPMNTPGMNMSGMIRDSSRSASTQRDATRDMSHMADSAMKTVPSMGAAPMADMMDLQMRMIADPVIRAHVLADSAMRRLMTRMIDQMPAEHRAMMRQMMHGSEQPASLPRKPSRKKPARTPAKKQPSDAKMKRMDESKMLGMKMPSKP